MALTEGCVVEVERGPLIGHRGRVSSPPDAESCVVVTFSTLKDTRTDAPVTARLPLTALALHDDGTVSASLSGQAEENAGPEQTEGAEEPQA
jgi:hypothetical protein